MSDFIFNEFKKEYLAGEIPSAFDADFVLVNSKFNDTYIKNDKLPAEKNRTLTDMQRLNADAIKIDANKRDYYGDAVVQIQSASGRYFKYEGNVDENVFDAEMPMFITEDNYDEFKKHYPENCVTITPNGTPTLTTLDKLFFNTNGRYYRKNINGFYYVRTKQELAWCANKVNGESDGSRLTEFDNTITIVLGDDIGTNSGITDDTADRIEFSIGKYLDRPFEGIFYGNNYGFINVAIMCNNDNNGIVGNLGENGIIAFVKLKGRTLLCNRNKIDLKHILDGSEDVNAGVLCGSNRGKIEFIDINTFSYLVNFFPDFTLVSNKTSDKQTKKIDSDKLELFPDYLNINSRKNLVPYAGYFNEGIYAPTNPPYISSDVESKGILDYDDEVLMYNPNKIKTNSSYPTKKMLAAQMDVYSDYSKYATEKDKKAFKTTKNAINAANITTGVNVLENAPLSAKKLYADVESKYYPFNDRSIKPHKFSRCAYYVSPFIGVNYGTVNDCSILSFVSAGSTFVGFCGGIAGKFAYGNVNRTVSNLALQDSQCVNMYSTDLVGNLVTFEDQKVYANSLDFDGAYASSPNAEQFYSAPLREYDSAVAYTNTKYITNLYDPYLALSNYMDMSKLSISAIIDVGFDELPNNKNSSPLVHSDSYRTTPVVVETKDDLRIEYLACSASKYSIDEKAKVYTKFNLRIIKKLTQNDFKEALSLANCFDSNTYYNLSAFNYIGVTDYLANRVCWNSTVITLEDKNQIQANTKSECGPFPVIGVLRPNSNDIDCYNSDEYPKVTEHTYTRLVNGASPFTIKINLEKILQKYVDNVIAQYSYDEASKSVKKGTKTFREFRNALKFNSVLRPIKNTYANEIHLPFESEVKIDNAGPIVFNYDTNEYKPFTHRSLNAGGISYKLTSNDYCMYGGYIYTHFLKTLAKNGAFYNKSAYDSTYNPNLTYIEKANNEKYNSVPGGMTVAYENENTSDYQSKVDYATILDTSLTKGTAAIRYKLSITYDDEIKYNGTDNTSFQELVFAKMLNPQSIYGDDTMPTKNKASNYVAFKAGTTFGNARDATWVAFSIYNVGGAFGNIALSNHTYMNDVSAILTNYLLAHSANSQYMTGGNKFSTEGPTYYDIGGLNKFGGFAAVCEYDASNMSDHIIRPRLYNMSNCRFDYGEIENRETSYVAGIASPLIAKLNPIYESNGAFIEHNDGLGYGPLDPIALTLHDYGFGIDGHSPNYYTTDMTVNVPGKRFWKVNRSKYTPYADYKEFDFDNNTNYSAFSACRPVDVKSIARCLFNWSTVTAGSLYNIAGNNYYTTSSIFRHTRVPALHCDMYQLNTIKAYDYWFSGYKKIDPYTVFGSELNVDSTSTEYQQSEIMSKIHYNYDMSRQYGEQIMNTVEFSAKTQAEATSIQNDVGTTNFTSANDTKTGFYNITAKYINNSKIFAGKELAKIDEFKYPVVPENLLKAFSILDGKRTIIVDGRSVDLSDNPFMVYDKEFLKYSDMRNVVSAKVYYSQKNPGYYTQFQDSYQNGEFDELLDGRKIDGSIYHLGTDCTPVQIKKHLNNGYAVSCRNISADDVQGLVVFAKYDNKRVPMMYIEKDFGDFEDGNLSIEFDAYNAKTLGLPTQKNAMNATKMYASLINIK